MVDVHENGKMAIEPIEVIPPFTDALHQSHPLDLAAPLAPIVVAGAIVNHILGELPAVVTVCAAAVAMFYYLLQIGRDPTVRAWFHNRKTKKILRMKAQLLKLEAKLPDPNSNPGS